MKVREPVKGGYSTFRLRSESKACSSVARNLVFTISTACRACAEEKVKPELGKYGVRFVDYGRAGGHCYHCSGTDDLIRCNCKKVFLCDDCLAKKKRNIYTKHFYRNRFPYSGGVTCDVVNVIESKSDLLHYKPCRRKAVKVLRLGDVETSYCDKCYKSVRTQLLRGYEK